MAPRSHPPAWYPDPADARRVRRWDGRGWTGEVRPVPDWLRTLRLSPGPPTPVPHPSRRLWWTSAALLLVGALFAVGLRVATPTSELRLHDRAFANRAAARCARAEAEVVSPNRRPQKGEAEVRRNEALAAGWEDMVLDLRRIDVARQDRGRVDNWLAAWDRWTSLGHDYAQALEAGDEAAAQRIVERSQIPKQVINAFAYANNMDPCAFR